MKLPEGIIYCHGCINPSEKYEFVNWVDYSIPRINGKNTPVMFQSPPTSHMNCHTTSPWPEGTTASQRARDPPRAHDQGHAKQLQWKPATITKRTCTGQARGQGTGDVGPLKPAWWLTKPLENIWKSTGMIIPNIWENKKCFKPPNRKRFNPSGLMVICCLYGFCMVLICFDDI